MIIKNCRTCKHYTENEEVDKEEMRDSVVYDMSTSWCWHPLSEGKIATAVMVTNGPCGRDLKLWEQKERNDDE